ncbi:MAG: zinc ribbon domain-containing protein [Gemmatimonadota bacterium]|nr:zinc ribbon domain-containing protein [Gemmatimonadota bacterium]
MLALIIGTALAVGALAYVLFPLLAGAIIAPVRRGTTRREAADAVGSEAIVALREIEFDRATGKLSDADYEELRARYTERALQAMRAGSDSSGDAAEAAVLAYRERLKHCSRCGPRPEPDAVYCSTCGLYLAGSCASCGAGVTEPGAAYCTSCGHALAA